MFPLKNGEVIDIITWPSTYFSVIKMFKLQNAPYLKKTDTRFNVRDKKHIFITDEKNFCLTLPVSYQNSRVCACRNKANVKQRRLLVECEKFANHVIVSAGMCFGMWYVLLHFVEGKAKVDCTYTTLATSFQISSTAIACCSSVHLPTRRRASTQNWLWDECPDFIAKDQWPPNSPDLNPLDYYVWGASSTTQRKSTRQTTISEKSNLNKMNTNEAWLATWNVNGLRAKWQEASEFVTDHDVIIFTETKLDGKASSKILSINGYRLFR